MKQHPDVIQRIFSWRVPGRADGKPFAINGILGCAPPLDASSGDRDRMPARLVAGLAIVSLLAVIGLWVAHRRSRRATQP